MNDPLRDSLDNRENNIDNDGDNNSFSSSTLSSLNSSSRSSSPSVSSLSRCSNFDKFRPTCPDDNATFLDVLSDTNSDCSIRHGENNTDDRSDIERPEIYDESDATTLDRPDDDRRSVAAGNLSSNGTSWPSVLSSGAVAPVVRQTAIWSSDEQPNNETFVRQEAGEGADSSNRTVTSLRRMCDGLFRELMIVKSNMRNRQRRDLRRRKKRRYAMKRQQQNRQYQRDESDGQSTSQLLTTRRSISSESTCERSVEKIRESPFDRLIGLLVECPICMNDFNVTGGEMAFNHNCTHFQCIKCLLSDYSSRIGGTNETTIEFALPAKACPICRSLSNCYLILAEGVGGCHLRNITTICQLIHLVDFYSVENVERNDIEK